MTDTDTDTDTLTVTLDPAADLRHALDAFVHAVADARAAGRYYARDVTSAVAFARAAVARPGSLEAVLLDAAAPVAVNMPLTVGYTPLPAHNSVTAWRTGAAAVEAAPRALSPAAGAVARMNRSARLNAARPGCLGAAPWLAADPDDLGLVAHLGPGS